MKSLLAVLLALLVPTLVHAAWGTDYNAALSQAKAENKLVLLHFTGSDWCPYCQLLDKEVLDRPSFQSFVDKHYVGVTVDFPQRTVLSDAVRQQNDMLQSQFNVEGFPTLLVVTPDGKELGRMDGYAPGTGEAAVVDRLKSFK